MDLQQLAVFFGFMTFWIVLNRWVLPRFGISTCMSGACAVNRRQTTTGGRREATGDES